jgi:hypothetical protein
MFNAEVFVATDCAFEAPTVMKTRSGISSKYGPGSESLITPPMFVQAIAFKVERD